jgi:hypothetical protein
VYTHHQIYRASGEQVIQALEGAMISVGGGLLGADWDSGIVMSRGVHARATDVSSVTKIDQDKEVVYFLVALISSRGEDEVEVQILTILSARSKGGAGSEGGFYTSGNALSERVYEELRGRLGEGLLKPAF